MVNCCVKSAQQDEGTKTHSGAVLIAGHDCPLLVQLVFLLLEAVISQGGLDGVLGQHLEGGR